MMTSPPRQRSARNRCPALDQINRWQPHTARSSESARVSRKHEQENWKLQFDGKKLTFPGWVEEKPIEQAKKQSLWLSKWLENSTGEKYKTTPVLAIPGWWIDRVAESNLRIFNGKNPAFLAKGPVMLDEKQIKSIAFHIDKQCRDVETKAYNP